MATTGKNETPFPAADEAVERIRELNEKLIAAAKQSGNVSLDAYEKTLKDMLAFSQKAAGATQLDFVQAVTQAHSTYISDISKAFTTAAREALK